MIELAECGGCTTDYESVRRGSIPWASTQRLIGGLVTNKRSTASGYSRGFGLAGVAQLVEHHLGKMGVASSSLATSSGRLLEERSGCGVVVAHNLAMVVARVRIPLLALETMMTLDRFIGYLKKNSNQRCPTNVSDVRWGAMLRWYDARRRFGEPLFFGLTLR